MNIQDQYFLLYSNCIPVKGISRAVICDLHRNMYHLIPNTLYDILEQFKLKKIEEIVDYFGTENEYIIYSYFHFLHEHDLIYYSELALHENFPSLSLDWDFPATVSNSIIEVADINSLAAKVNQLSSLGCNYLELRFMNVTTLEELQKEIAYIVETKIHLIDIYLPFNESLPTTDKLLSFLENYPIINMITVYNSPEEHFNISNESCVGYLFFTPLNLSSNTHCGKIRETYFAINIPHFTESLAHNSCLNRKISIDTEGNIKNCPSMKESYGNINNTSLEEALQKPGFKKYWNITKDQITKCKDCEFRYVCTDCRAYLDEPDNLYSAPLKCGYDPYTCEWEEWSTNPLKQKAIDHYQIKETIPNFH